MPEQQPQIAAAETRRLAAIMFTDMVGFSRQMGDNETRMLRLLEVHNQLIRHAVTEHHGTVIKTIGDAFLVDFPSGRGQEIGLGYGGIVRPPAVEEHP